MKKFGIISILALCWSALILESCSKCPAYLGNSLQLLMENNFFIPKESSVCTFEETMSDTGSGEGWLYGEHYYGINQEYDSRADPIYYILKKGEESANFNKFDYNTWDKKEAVMWYKKR